MFINVCLKKIWHFKNQRGSQAIFHMVLAAEQWMETATQPTDVIYSAHVHTQNRKLAPGGEWTWDKRSL